MKKKKVDRRAVGNEVGKLITQHREAVKELERAWDKYRELVDQIQGGIGYRGDVLAAIEATQDRIGALEKLVSDLYERIVKLNTGRLSRV